MEVTFLGAQVPLTKAYSVQGGKLLKEPYPHVKEFTSITVEVGSLAELAKVLPEMAEHGYCMLKGNVKRKLERESRAGSTEADAPTELMVLDLDGIEAKNVNAVIRALGLNEYTHIVQYSAGYGIDGPLTYLKCHVFFQLEAPEHPNVLKSTMIALNLEVPMLEKGVRLTRTGHALRWPLDITVNQNDKLIYIAAPTLGEGVSCEFKGKRIEYVKRKKLKVPNEWLRPDVAFDQLTKLNALRSAAGLPAKRMTEAAMSGESYTSADGVTITGTREARGFMYFNLNGGDSWGYYTPLDTPTYVDNFKGEPRYRLSDLDKDLAQQLKDNAKKLKKREPQTVEPKRGDTEYVFFMNVKTNVYYAGTIRGHEVNVDERRNRQSMIDFAQQHGLGKPDFVPDGKVIFDPQEPQVWDPDTRTLNSYVPPEFAHLPKRKVSKPPAHIDKLVTNAFGGSPVKEHFYNWLAFIAQRCESPRTAYVGHGIQGTGKGVLFHKVIARVLGRHNVTAIRMTQLEEHYNGWMENKMLVFVDEAHFSDLREGRKIMSSLKSFLTEPRVMIRRHYASAYEADNRCAFIFASNQPDPVQIDPDDRRFNVGEFGATKLEVSEEFIARVNEEVEEFYMFVHSLVVDEKLACTPLVTETRRDMIETNRHSMDRVADALKAGDLAFLWDQRSIVPLDRGDGVRNDYNALLDELVLRGYHESNRLSRDQLYLIFAHCCGNVPTSPHKFTTYLRHRGIKLQPMRISGVVVQAQEFHWKFDAAWLEERRTESLPQPGSNVAVLKRGQTK